MRVLHESADELTIFSPARTARIAAAILLAAGLLLGLPIGIPVLVAGIRSFWGPPTDPVWGMSAPLIMIIPGVLFCLIPVAGLMELLRAKDTEYHFLGNERKLSVVVRNEERQGVAFPEIVKAEAYTNSGNDEPSTYGLRLKLLGFGRKLQMTQVDCSGDAQRCLLLELAERINRFLEEHPNEPPEATSSDQLKGLARLQPVSSSPDAERSKACPRCGRKLNVYAVKCHSCKEDVE